MGSRTQNSGSVRVLVMEDDPSMARLICNYLSTRGFQATPASDARTGLELYSPERFDLILLDYRLPDRDGLEVLQSLRKITAFPPVVMVSGLGLEKVAAEAMKLGALDYVAKGGEGDFLEELLLSVHNALQRKRELEDLRAAGEERARWMEELRQRVRELGCLYGIEKLLGMAEEPDHSLLNTVAELVAGACHSRGDCSVRLRADGLEGCSRSWRETPWKGSFPLRCRSETLGTLEVAWLEPPRLSEQALFSSPEEDLLQSVADRLAVYFDRIHSARQLMRAQEELRKLHRAMEHSATAVMITDAGGHIEYVNAAFTSMTGYSREEVLGKTPRILKSGEKKPEEYREMWRLLSAGHEWRGEFHNRHKDGSLYWDYSIISPITNELGDVTHFVAVKQDVSAEKEAEKLRQGVLAISACVAGCDDEDALCRTVVEGVRMHMDVDRCGLFLVQPDGVLFRGTYGTDLQGRTTDEHQRTWDIRREPHVEDLFASGTYKMGFPLGNPPPTEDERGLYASLVVLRHRGEVFGVICVDNRIRRGNVSESQTVHIALLAEIIGNALQAARAREALRRLLEQRQQAMEEIERFNRAMLGREQRIIELKEEVNALLKELGRPLRYEPVWQSAERGDGKNGEGS